MSLSLSAWQVEAGQRSVASVAMALCRLWHSAEGLRPGRPEFKPLCASSWLETVDMLHALPQAWFSYLHRRNNEIF